MVEFLAVEKSLSLWENISPVYFGSGSNNMHLQTDSFSKTGGAPAGILTAGWNCLKLSWAEINAFVGFLSINVV